MDQGLESRRPQTAASEAELVLGVIPYLKPTSSPSLAAWLTPVPGGGVWKGCG